MIFRHDLGKVLMVFLLPLSIFLSFLYCSSRPSILFLSSCFRFSFQSSTPFSLKYSRGVHARMVWMIVSLQEGGAAAASVVASFGWEEKSSLFLSMDLNMVGYVWMLGVLILAPFFGYPWNNSLMFST